MRRSDFDVSDRIRTTDPIAVRDEVLRLYRGLYAGRDSRPIRRAFTDVARMFGGKHPDYHPCDTDYHDLQHTLDVTLATARLLDGYDRGLSGTAPLPAAYFNVGVITALFHDFGYLRHRRDHRHRFGAEYTLTHVERGSRYLREYLPSVGMKQYAAASSQIVHFTGYERHADSIRLADPLLRRVGEILGTADIVAQMSDRCYLEKCRDRLYPEFVLGGLAKRTLPDGRVVTVFKSASDLVRQTPGFYYNAMKRLDQQLHGAYRYAERHFRGRNHYLDEMQKNVRYAEKMASTPAGRPLRRSPPSTLLPDVIAYPEDLVIV